MDAKAKAQADGVVHEDWRNHTGLVGTWVKRIWPKVEPTGVSKQELFEIGLIKLWECFQPGKYDPAKSKPATYAMRALFRHTRRAVAHGTGHKTENQMQRAWNTEWSIDAPAHGPHLLALEGILGRSDADSRAEIREHLDHLFELARPTDDERVLFEGLLQGRTPEQIMLRVNRSKTWVSAKTGELVRRMARADQLLQQHPGLTAEDLYLIRQLANMTGGGYDKGDERTRMTTPQGPHYRLGHHGMPIRNADGEVFPARTLVAEMNRLASLADMATGIESSLRERAEVAEAESQRLTEENSRLNDINAGNDREIRLLQQKLADALKAADNKTPTKKEKKHDEPS